MTWAESLSHRENSRFQRQFR